MSTVCSALLMATAALALPAEAAEDKINKQESSNKIAEQQRITLPTITITEGMTAGSPRQLPGSSSYIDKKTLQQGNYSDVTRAVRTVPGVNVQEEEGFGSRPNIGMRGGRVDRSADITLMEDGILIAPAPYSAPAAYYFPRIERMEGIEVRKGSSSIKYGPRTTNGALNLLSSTVPTFLSGRATVGAGSFGGLKSGVTLGDSPTNNVGYVLDAYTSKSDGFKEIDSVGGDTGFVLQDYMGKLRFKTDAAARYYQELEFKAGYTEENSDETYLGLTTADFNQNPNRRYAASQEDMLTARHKQFQLSHYIEPMAGMGVTTTVYRNDFDRNWFRLQSVRAGGSKVGIGAVLNDPTTYSAELDILRGATSAANGLQIRSNKREYYAQGIQTAATYRTEIGGYINEMEFGLRYHQDEQDRFQKEDDYQMINGTLFLTTPGALGSESNRVGSADAIAGYALNRIELGRLAVTPGVRYEYIKLKTEDYGKTDPNRTGVALNKYESTITAVIPGLGIDYALTDQWTALAGIHKGFAPPEPPTTAIAAENAKEEESINYELGARYNAKDMQADVIGFLTDYDNLLGTDTFSSGGSGANDQFNGGEVRVYGLEASVNYNLGALRGQDAYSTYRYPLRLAYTYTHAEFRNAFRSNFEEWGNVSVGDELPYIPEHQLYASVGVETDKWLVNFGGRFAGKMRTVAGQGDFIDSQSTDQSFTVDANAEYEILPKTRFFVNAVNLLDEQYIAARRPAGVRPGAPQIIFAGFKVNF